MTSCEIAAVLREARGFFHVPDGLDEETTLLVSRFARALAEKLYSAQCKYGYSDGWKRDDWMDECRAKLVEHIAKGDPRDVAAYCAFLWHHGESTAPLPAVAGVTELLIEAVNRLNELGYGTAAMHVNRAIADHEAALGARKGE